MTPKGQRLKKFFQPIDCARDYVRRFPKAGHSSLARKIMADQPSVFPNVDAARQAVRRARGKHGNGHRQVIASKELFESEPRPFTGLPPGKKQLPDWKHFEYDAPGWWLVISDLHIPFHDDAAINAAFKEAKRRNVVGILINGDLLDFYDLGVHEKDPRQRHFREEIEIVRDFLEWLREQFPKANVVWKIGNHEERYQRFMFRKAPELLDLDDFQLESFCRCDDHGVEVIKHCQGVALGKLLLIHGHEYQFAISNPVSAARGLFLRAGVSSLCGHFHRTSQFSKRDLTGHLVSTWSAGCLCDLRPLWLPINDWNLGCCFVEVMKAGAYGVENLRYVDGRLYQ